MNLFKLFSFPVYVQVYKNKFVVRACDGSNRSVTAIPETPFTTCRLLVGDFLPAENTLQSAVKQLQGKGLHIKTPAIVMHPMEMLEGGLCMVEEKLFRELAMGAGAHKVALHTGAELNQSQILALLN